MVGFELISAISVSQKVQWGLVYSLDRNLSNLRNITFDYHWSSSCSCFLKLKQKIKPAHNKYTILVNELFLANALVIRLL